MTHAERQVAEEVDESAPGPGQPAIPWQQRDRDELLNEILTRLAEGETLTAICESRGMPSLPVVKKWRRDDPELQSRFAHAREEWREVQEELCVAISDSSTKETVEVDKLRIWTRLQLLDRASAHAKLNPHKSKTAPTRIMVVGIEPRQAALAHVIEGQVVRPGEDD